MAEATALGLPAPDAPGSPEADDAATLDAATLDAEVQDEDSLDVPELVVAAATEDE